MESDFGSTFYRDGAGGKGTANDMLKNSQHLVLKILFPPLSQMTEIRAKLAVLGFTVYIILKHTYERVQIKLK